MIKLNHYRPRRQLMTSVSIPLKDETDYLELRQKLRPYGITLGQYIVSAYRELDQGTSDDLRLKALAWESRS